MSSLSALPVRTLFFILEVSNASMSKSSEMKTGIFGSSFARRLDDETRIVAAGKLPTRWCQTNQNSPRFARRRQNSGRAEPAQLSKGGVAAGLENLAGGEVAFLVEVVMNRALYRCEFLQTSHLPKAKHRPFASSEGQVAVLGPVIEPPPYNALI